MASGSVANVLPSWRSGVCTVWPAARRASAKALTPSVRPWAWWNTISSVIRRVLTRRAPRRGARRAWLPPPDRPARWPHPDDLRSAPRRQEAVERGGDTLADPRAAVAFAGHELELAPGLRDRPGDVGRRAEVVEAVDED